MKRPYLWPVCALVAALSAGTGAAQPPAPGGVTRPPFSPYLNLVRPGSSPALNYYGLVRPELQFRQSIQNLQGEVALNQQAIGSLAAGDFGLSTTGHPTQFLNYGGYFLNPNPGGPLTGGVGAGATWGTSGGGFGTGGTFGSGGGLPPPPRRR